MRKSAVAFITVIILALSLQGAAIAPGTSIGGYWEPSAPAAFSDLEGYSWAEEHIYNLTKYGIIKGYITDDGSVTFRPANLMTRAEFAKTVVCAFGAYLADARVDMFDNPRETWTYPYISSAVVSGIASGYSDEFFGAQDNIMRQDVAVLLVRAINHAEFEIPETANKKVYNDINAASDYALEAIDFFSSRGVFQGDENGNFNPKDNAERAEIAVLINRILTNSQLK